MKKSTIAILGRPNVGKSTLFNRIVGRVHSIVSSIEGVTRDRVSESFNWAGKDYNIIDTGGFIHNSKHVINKEVNLQSDVAQQEADLILFLMDSRSEITANDRELSQKVIRSGKPYIFVLNKIDTQSLEINKDQFYELGLDEPVLVSAETGYNLGNLLDIIVSRLPGEENNKNLYDFSIAVIGMPNVGKSSFVNRILNKKQSIVTNIAGTTRDSIDSYFRYFNNTIKLIDTAGLRKKTKIIEDIEFYSLLRTERSIDNCDITIVMIDGLQGFSNQDRDIIRMIIDKGKGMVIVVNKWDLINKDSKTMNDYLKEIIYNYPSVEHYPVIFISVLENKKLQNVLSLCLSVYNERAKKIKTNELNTWLNKILNINPPPAVKGKYLKIKYVSQVRTHPPLFVFFTNHPNLFPISYKRFLENQIRLQFGFKGVSLKISFRQK